MRTRTTHGHHAGHGRGSLSRLVSRPLWVGVLALLWLVLRSGRKPSRLLYPCQQAALSGVSLAFALALAPCLLAAGTWLAKRKTRLAVVGLSLAVLVLGGISDTSTGQSRARRGARAPADYRADVYVVEAAGGPAGDHHLGLDTLVACMGAAGQKLYRSPTVGPEAGPDGLVGPDDIVLVKINQQWPERGGTNTDVLKGLVARLLEHPDGFRGEVVVVENGQGRGTFDWPEANAEDHGQSALDVVDHFAGLGRPVSAWLWDDIRSNSVAEYADGDLRDGYVVDAWDADAQIGVSYPKFRTAGGHYVSLRHGVWDPGSSTYDASRLRFISVPVLKCHVTYGVTAAVKHHVGTMTTGLGTNTHAAVRNGAIGTFLARVRMPDLNILDCTYILAIPSAGPGCSYAQATRAGVLVASRDPVALDLWATTHVLVPAFVANGYTDYPAQDPADPSSTFRSYLDLTAERLLAAGITVTNDPASITAHIRRGTGPGPDTTRATLGPRPNPFLTGTAIRFLPTRTGTVRLEVYDLNGRLRRAITESVQAGAAHEIPWDGRDASGRRLAPGTYCYRLSGTAASASGKVTLLR